MGLQIALCRGLSQVPNCAKFKQNRRSVCRLLSAGLLRLCTSLQVTTIETLRPALFDALAHLVALRSGGCGQTFIDWEDVTRLSFASLIVSLARQIRPTAYPVGRLSNTHTTARIGWAYGHRIRSPSFEPTFVRSECCELQILRSASVSRAVVYTMRSARPSSKIHAPIDSWEHPNRKCASRLRVLSLISPRLALLRLFGRSPASI